MIVRLGEIAYARSGDKGASVNVGVAARDPRLYTVLVEALTAERVREHFADICKGLVRRYELPNLHALNFVLEETLDGGATRCLRLDAQGKTVCDGLLTMELEVPDELVGRGAA